MRRSPQHRTATQVLADHLLRQPVDDWVRDRRAEGLSWRRVALELRDVTKSKIDVSDVTVRAWVQGDDTPADQPAAATS